MNIAKFRSNRNPAVTKTLMSNRQFVKYSKVAASLGIFAIFLGGAILYAVDSNNKIMMDKLRQMHLSFETRVRRSLNNNAGASDHQRAKRDSEDDEAEFSSTSAGTRGVTYERWGRTDCSGPDNELIYHGLGAASYYSYSGGVSNSLCLYGDIKYTENRFVDGFQGKSYLFGMEFRDSSWVKPLFNLSLTESDTFQYHSMSCAICLAKTKTSKVMIPGRATCPTGWTKEYRGYIMSNGHSDKHSSDAICVDDTPQVVPGTGGSQGGAYVYMVETHCTSLLCQPYVEGRELTCVVCTK